MKIAVGLSGGVDSSVTALLLKQQGHDIIGVTMKVWDGSFDMKDEGHSACFGPGEYRDIEAAASLCARLEIEHHVVDLSKEYNREVIQYFRAEYLAGRTPNPCTRCNRILKLGLLVERALEQGLSFEAFATGHYARISFDKNSNRYLLKKGIDHKKDQSYFISLLNQQQLSRLVLPLGELTKEQVRDLASGAGWLDLAEKDESQDFIESKNYSVLFKPEDFRQGKIVDESGKVVGEHSGIINYTIGQRKGLCGGAAEPRYVVGINASDSTVHVGGRNHLQSSKLKASNLNWTALESLPAEGFKATTKIRQQHRGAEAVVTPLDGSESVLVSFTEPQNSVTPGQTVTFYNGDVVLGAGVIDEGIR